MLGAVILAAGLSSRMEAFKPLLKIGGETMIFRVVTMMKRAGASQIAVVTGFRREELEESLMSLKAPGVIFVRNERYRETQMLDSLRLGLQAVKKCDRILIFPADVPLVSPETAKALLRINAQFLRPVYRGEPGHPVLINSEIIPVIERYEGCGGLKGAMEASGVDIAEMETDDRGVVLDADSPEDYKKLLELFASTSKKGDD